VCDRLDVSSKFQVILYSLWQLECAFPTQDRRLLVEGAKGKSQRWSGKHKALLRHRISVLNPSCHGLFPYLFAVWLFLLVRECVLCHRKSDHLPHASTGNPFRCTLLWESYPHNCVIRRRILLAGNLWWWQKITRKHSRRRTRLGWMVWTRELSAQWLTAQWTWQHPSAVILCCAGALGHRIFCWYTDHDRMITFTVQHTLQLKLNHTLRYALQYTLQHTVCCSADTPSEVWSSHVQYNTHCNPHFNTHCNTHYKKHSNIV